MTDDVTDDVMPHPVPGRRAGQPGGWGPGTTAALTCLWACVISAALMGVATAGLAVTGNAADAWILVLVWMVVAVVAWLVGWPAGLVAESLLERRGASARSRVVTFAVLGAVASLPITWSSPFWVGAPVLLGAFAVLAALGSGGGRWVVLVRARRHAGS